jgi:hypothetical protein
MLSVVELNVIMMLAGGASKITIRIGLVLETVTQISAMTFSITTLSRKHLSE